MFDEDLLENIVSKEKQNRQIAQEIKKINEDSWRPFYEMTYRFLEHYGYSWRSTHVGNFHISWSTSLFITTVVVRYPHWYSKKILMIDHFEGTSSLRVKCKDEFIPLLEELYSAMAEMVKAKIENNTKKLEVTQAETKLIHFGI